MDKKISIPITTFSISDSVLKAAVNKIENPTGGGATPPLDQSVRVVLPDTSEPSQRRQAKLGKARGICFTLYKYDNVLEDLRAHAKSATYCVLGFEVCPQTGRKHIQGYIYYDNQRSMDKFSGDWNNCHVERSKGTPKQASDYCKYDDYPQNTKPNVFEEYGHLPSQGQRRDWAEVVQELKSGTSVQEVIEDQPHLVPYTRAIREIKGMFLKPLNRDVEVVVLYGKGGTGKTRWAYDRYPELYKKPSGEWWNGYEGQKVVLLDDFYGWIKYHDLLTILDRYAVNLPIKGGYLWAQYDKVVITSNQHPRHWYKNQWGWPLRRRLNKIIEVKVIDGETCYQEEDFPASEEAWNAS